MMNAFNNSVENRLAYIICYGIIDLKIIKGMIIVNYPDSFIAAGYEFADMENFVSAPLFRKKFTVGRIETAEVIIGAAKHSKEETIYEISDLAYHVLVLMVEMGISVDDIRKELDSRHVIDHKVKQETMQ